MLTNCFQEASNNNVESLAIPPIGIGKLDFDPRFVALVVRQELLQFSRCNPQTTLRDVRCVVYQKDDRVIQVSPYLQWRQSSQLCTNFQCGAWHCRRERDDAIEWINLELTEHENESRWGKHEQFLHCET